jgi:hypothetical protein
MGRQFEDAGDPFMKRLVLVAAICAAHLNLAHAALDTAKIDEITGLKGKLNEKEGVYRVTFPRADVPVTVEAWKMPQFMGLGTWAAFTKGSHAEAMLMGDTVLFEDEVNPVMSVAFENGLEVTALHNHFFFEQPRVFFMHIGGEGTVEQLATATRKVYDKIKEVRASNPKPRDTFGSPALPDKSAITPEPINAIFGLTGEAKDGMLKFVIGRPAKMHGVDVGKDMGVNTWAAFAGAEDNALVDGDFAVTEDELQPALKSLRAAGINIVAIHSHMTQEEPRILFFHYWGRGKASDLATAVKQALGLTKHEEL